MPNTSNTITDSQAPMPHVCIEAKCKKYLCYGRIKILRYIMITLGHGDSL